MRVDSRVVRAGVAAVAVILTATTVHAQDPYATAPPYAKPVLSGAALTPVITVGQQVQLTGAPPSTLFRFVGIPDGLGAVLDAGQLRVFCNHEFNQNTGVAAGPLAGGTRITEMRLTALPGFAAISSAKDAIQNVYAGEPPVLVTPSATTRFARFCSGYLGGSWSGLDETIYFAGEETSGAATFDGQGGSAVAVAGGNLYQLPRLGHAPWENIVVLPYTGSKTAVLGAEDAGSLTSQMYLYVGDKVPGHADVLMRNGLSNGQLHVLAFDDPTRKNEATFLIKNTSVPVHWAQVNYAQNDAGLEAQSQSVGSFNFVRVEDVAYDKARPGIFYFVTTGSPGSPNPFGRLYRLDYDPADPAGPATLTLLLDGTEGVISPDNIDINAQGELMLCEDPNYNLATGLGLARDTYLWRYDVTSATLTPVAEIDRAPAIAHALAADPLNSNVAASNTPGGWEFSGIIDASEWTGPGTWLLDIQAHSLRINPTAATLEGGQVLLLTIDTPTGTNGTLRLQGSTSDNGRVELTWAAANSSNLAGFRVEIATDEQGPWTPLHEGLLAFTETRYVDEPGPGDWYYRIASYAGGEMVDSDVFFAHVGVRAGSVAFAAPAPNPSGGRQMLRFRLPATIAGTPVDLSVFDVGGRKVRTLFAGQAREGEISVSWNGDDASGQKLRGVFFARLATREGTLVRRIIRSEN